MSTTRLRILAVFFTAAMVTVALTAATPAGAAFGINSPDVKFEQADGSPAMVAGAHPFALSTSFRFNTITEGATEAPAGSPKDLDVELPVGIAGIPRAVPQCSGADFVTVNKQFESLPPSCSNDSAIGYVTVEGGFFPVPLGHREPASTLPLYNLAPGPGSVAKFGFLFDRVPITIEVMLSESSPYRVVAVLRHTPQSVLLFSSAVTVWGDPGSSVHDPYRGTCLAGKEPDGTLVSLGTCPLGPGIPNVAFLTNPRACTGPLSAQFAADSWEGATGAPETVLTHDTGGQPVGFSGCEALGFAPSISVASSAGETEVPMGLDFTDSFPQDEGLTNPLGRANSDLRKIVAELPQGVTINPSAGNGLVGCTTAQFEAERLTTAPGAACPQAAKIGTVTATSPLVEEPLEGAIFAATPDNPTTTNPREENPFDSFLAIYLVLRNQNLGVIVKQAGKVEADSQTGQLTATFEDAPQLPISRIETHFREGERAPLATPGQCGTYTAEALQSSWSGKEVVTTAEFQIGSGPGGAPCPSGNGRLGPRVQAGTSANNAGAYAPFALHLTRRDGEADLTHLSVALPEGLTGRLAGIGQCPDSAIATIQARSGREELASPTCPAGSRLGSVTAGAGVGPALTYVSGSVYLAGPYLGAPFSILAITPAVAGPFDLGNVVIREPLRIDPFTAQVTVDGSAAPLPRILKGIPLELRDLRIDIDRPGFTLNSTSCEPKQLTAIAAGAGPSLSSMGETSADLTTRYQAAGCSALSFKPRLKIRLKGSMKHAGHPALRAVLTYPKLGAYANIARAQVNLPHSEFIDQANLNKTCTKPVLLAGGCPRTTIYGKAKAWTPLLDKPLEGPVYLVGGFGYKLPALVAELNGQIRVLLVGKVDSGPNKGIRNTFEAVPDAPVSRFVIQLKGGRKYSLLENSENLCRKPQRANARFTAQNGKILQMKPVIGNSCKSKHKRKRSKHKRKPKKRGRGRRH